MIRLDNLTKIFETPNGPVTAADHITLEVAAGETCVLLGPSGCGKTTTLKMVNRIIPPTSGRVLINGEDTTGVDTETLRRKIGYVIQQIGLFPNMTIEENITVVPRLLGWDKKRYAQRARELLEIVALDAETFLKRYPYELSGGQQQRVGVARALAADPPVMLMDEPFGAIDPINRATIQDEFLKMQQALKKTILFVSHDIDEAVKMGSSIAIFRTGKLVQHDTPDDLLSAPVNSFVESFLGEDRALKRLNLTRVRDVVNDDMATVSPGDSLQTALERMDAHGYSHAILMIDEAHRPVGLVSRAVAQTLRGVCRDHYQGLLAVVGLDDDLRKVASEMFANDVTWLPCVDAKGRACGQITQRAMTHHLASRVKRSKHNGSETADLAAETAPAVMQAG